MLDRSHKWHQTKPGFLVFAIVELAVVYGFGSLAIDRGDLWWYLLTLVFLVGSLQNLFKLIGSFSYGHKRKTSKA
jgi:hypothetical protein